MKNSTKILLFFITFLFSFFVVSSNVYALGITPPKIIINNALPSSYIEKTIILTRTNTKENTIFTYKNSFNNQEINNGIIINNNQEIVFKTNQNKLPINIKINLPTNISTGTYHGQILFIPFIKKNVEEQIQVQNNIPLEIKFNICENEIVDYEINNVAISDFKNSEDLPLMVSITNNSNIPILPNRIEIDIYNMDRSDFLDKLILIPTEKDFLFINSFKEESILFNLEHKDLETGHYLSFVKVFNNNDKIIKEQKIIFEVKDKNFISNNILIENLELSKTRIEKGEITFLQGTLQNKTNETIQPTLTTNIFYSKKSSFLKTTKTEENNKKLISTEINNLQKVSSQQVYDFKIPIVLNKTGKYNIILQAKTNTEKSEQYQTHLTVIPFNRYIYFISIISFLLLIITLYLTSKKLTSENN